MSNTLLFEATTAYISASTDAGAALAPLFRGRTMVCHWQSAQRLWPDTRRMHLSNSNQNIKANICPDDPIIVLLLLPFLELI